MKRYWALIPLAVLAFSQLGGSCGSGGGENAGSGGTSCDGRCDNSGAALTVADVDQIIRQAVVEALASGVTTATIAVLDKVNNVLAVYQMAPPEDFTPQPVPAFTYLNPDPANEALITQANGVLDGVVDDNGAPTQGQRWRTLEQDTGLKGVTIPNTLAAISKAGTSSFFSTQGNAFSTRTTSQVVQELFNPGEFFRGLGPLYGVQFAQLPCNNFSRRLDQQMQRGPKRLPVGFSADTGAVSLYKNNGSEMGIPVGAVAVEFDNLYDVDEEIINPDIDVEERIAAAASFGFAAPVGRRAYNITIDGRALRFTEDEAFRSDPASVPSDGSETIDDVMGDLVSVPGWFGDFAANGITVANPPTLQPGIPFTLDTPAGTAQSGVVLSQISSTLGGPQNVDAEFLVDDMTQIWFGQPPPAGAPAPTDPVITIDSTNPTAFPGGAGLSDDEVQEILVQVLKVAERTRAQARLPLNGQRARIDVAVVDRDGEILGVARSPDALVDGITVVAQKAQTVVFFSDPNVLSNLRSAPDPLFGACDPLTPPNPTPPPPPASCPAPGVVGLLGVQSYAQYADQLENAFNVTLPTGTAFSTTAVGVLASPYLPVGEVGRSEAPLSRFRPEWSIFSTGFQLESTLPFIALALCPLVNDLRQVLDDLTGGLVDASDPSSCPDFRTINSCTSDEGDALGLGLERPELEQIDLGPTLFPGGFPIYDLSDPNNPVLIGGVGVSGDGVEQNDLIALLGLANAGTRIRANDPARSIGNAPRSIRVNNLQVTGNVSVRWSICPVAPFLDSNEQEPCKDL